MNQKLCILPLAALLLATSIGCMPNKTQSKPPTVDGPIDSNTASQLHSKLRSAQGNVYSITHQYKDQDFKANWEISNALKRSSKLQLKPPGDWSFEDVQQAMKIVLADHETKPWYGEIDSAVLLLMSEANDEKDNRATGFAEETPYDIAVKVNHYPAEWFVEVKVQLVEPDGTRSGI